MNLITYLLMFPQEGSEGGGGFMSFLPIVLIIVVFYFFFIRPQSKKNKELQKFRQGLQKGDKIITAGGIHGKVMEVQETAVIIEVEGQTRLKVEITAVSADASQVIK